MKLSKLAVVLLLVSISLGPLNVLAAEKPIVLKYHFEQSVTAPMSVYGHFAWGKDVERATNGRVQIQYFPSDTLFKTKTEALEGTMAGVTDIAFMFAWAYSPQLDLIDALSIPFAVPNAEVASRATWRLYEAFPEIQKQWKDVKLLSTWTTAPYYFTSSKKQIKTLEDFKGMKIRTTGGILTEMVKLFGGSPMTVPLPNAYENLQKGVIDGLACNSEIVLGFRTYEVTPYFTLVPSTIVSQQLIMNKKAWERLPKDVQEQIMSVSGEQGAIRYGGGAFDRSDDLLDDALTKEGKTINKYVPPPEEIERWKAAAQPLAAEWVTKMESRGINNAAEIQATALKFVAEIIAEGRLDYWRDLPQD